MMLWLRKFIENAQKRWIIWWGGGAALVVVGLGVLMTHFLPVETQQTTVATTTVVTPSASAVVSGNSPDFNASVDIGRDEERVVSRQLIDALKPVREEQEKLVALVARAKAVAHAPLRAILRKLGETGARGEEIPKRLDEKADELLKLREEVAELQRGPAELTSFAQQAQTLLDEGDLEGARAALAQGRSTAHTLREQSARYEADFLAQEAKLDHLQFAYRRAAAKYADAAELVAGLDQQRQWELLLAQAAELHRQGYEFGDDPALQESVAVYRHGLLLAPRLQGSLDWAMTQIGLGTALYSLGDLEMSTTRLEEAIVAFQDALKVSTRARAPRQWVAAQIGLGNALSWIGGRASRTVRTRERAPLQWAAMQMGFDAFLSGERESGAARLDDAIATYRNALKEFGIVLLSPPGQHETGPAQLREAVTAYRAALQEMPRTRFPVEWATTQNNLGSALRELGERERGTTKLEQAVSAFRDALKVSTRERTPLDWAATQFNLGLALRALGERERGTTKLEEAITAFRDALEEFTEDRAPLDWSMTRNNLDLALRVLGDRGSGTTKLKQAIPAGALNEQEREPLDTLATQTDRRAVPRGSAERERNDQARKREYRLSSSPYRAFRDTRMRR